MGRGMAQRILGGGHDLRRLRRRQRAGRDRSPPAGAHAAASVADVCAGRDVVVTMLVEDAAVARRRDRGPAACATRCRRARSTWRWARTASAPSRALGARATPPPARCSSPRRCSAGRIWLHPVSSASCRAGPDEAVRVCAPLLELMGRTHVPRRAAAGERRRPSSSPTTCCSAARWWRWPKACRSCAATTSRRQTFYDVIDAGAVCTLARLHRLRQDDGRRELGHGRLSDHGRPQGREPHRRPRPTSRACRCRATTSIAIACSAPWRTATATATRPCSRASRRARQRAERSVRLQADVSQLQPTRRFTAVRSCGVRERTSERRKSSATFSVPSSFLTT